jgi:16S rRNA C967 or C1407 C5-methylase (RsmB/RsmF family)/NOL1/NOP2/fmu family ribosome biogenesis protein
MSGLESQSERGSVFSIAEIESAVGAIEIPKGASAMLDALMHRHSNALRMHRGAAALEFATKPVDWYSLGRKVNDPGLRPSRSLAYAGGDFYLQDSGSLLALAAAGCDTETLAGLTVCDLCAAPGGKASALLEAVGEDGFLLANEPIRSRIAPLKYNLARTGSDRYAISSLDPDRLADQVGSEFDLVLVDAPCSGQALMSRGKQNPAAMTGKQVQHSALRQNRILDAAVRLLKPGGRLVYSTCTFAVAENESQIRRLIDAGSVIPASVTHLSDYQSHQGCYRLWPHLHDCAGSFAATARLSDSFPAQTIRRSRKKSKNDTRVRDKQLPKDWRQWYESDGADRLNFHINGPVLFGYVADAPDWVQVVAVAGPELAYRTGQTWKPSHEAAMRKNFARMARQTHQVDDVSAEAFMAGETVLCPQRGWKVVAYQDRPLGWIKSDGRVGKNHLPGSARW